MNEDELQLEVQLGMRRVGLVQVTPNGYNVVQSFAFSLSITSRPASTTMGWSSSRISR
jgi:hypothetical protein